MKRIHELLENKPENSLAIQDFDNQNYSYSQLKKMSSQLAKELKQHGVEGGDKVVVVSENSAMYAACLFGLSKINAWSVFVNARQSKTEIESIIKHSKAKCVLFTTRASKQARDHAKNLSASTIADIDCGPIVCTPLYNQKPEKVIDDGEQVAVLLYTTGTTSAPKAVMLSHNNLLFNSENSAKHIGLNHNDKVLGVLPGTHIYCLASAFLPVIFAGGSIQFVPRFKPDEVLEFLRGGITRFPGVPQMFASIIEILDKNNETLNAPHLRNLATGGAPLDPDVKIQIEKIFKLQLNNGYGITECSPTIAVTKNEVPRSDLSVGLPVPNIEVKIDKPNKDNIGEILVRGKNVMKGYYRDARKTKEVITPDGYFKTGDLGYFGKDGALFVVGRSKELIIRSGFNVFPPEIEAMLTKHPSVYQAAVIGKKTKTNEEILAFILTDGAVIEDELKQWLRKYLAPYKIPQHIYIVKKFPTAATGKILKHKLTTFFADILN